jgi:two-component system LytT family sensor kinase
MFLSLQQRLPLRSWLSIGLIWVALGLINGTQIVIGMRAVRMQHHWTALFIVSALTWLVWACATPLVVALGRKFPPTRTAGWKPWPVHLAASMILGAADAVWIGGLFWALNPYGVPNPTSFRDDAISFFYQRFHVSLITYAAILAVSYMLDSLKRLAAREAEAARLSAELSKAQLDALRRQLEPHFLFNTLNGIAGLVRDNRNHAAVDMIAGLSDLLRRVLEGSDRQLVPLAEELSFLESYIDLQVMRFGDRLKVTVEVPLKLYGALVPGLILQPLVENAIVHGIGQCVDGGTVRVGARETAGILTLYIHNDGPLLPAGRVQNSSGVGLTNTRGRLHTLYGPACSLELRDHDVAGVETIVEVPYRVQS